MFRQFIRLLSVLFVAALACGAADAYTLTSDEGRFSVELPDKPIFNVRRLKRIRDGAIFESKEWRLDQPWHTWLVSYRDYSLPGEDPSAEKIFDRVLQELPAGLDGELRSHHYFEREGARALEIHIFVPRNRMLLRSQIFVDSNRRYVVSYVGPDGSENEPAVDAYLNSFHVRH